MALVTYEASAAGSNLSLYRRVFGALTNATTVTLSDPTNTFGIMRLDNHATTVAAGAATTHPLTGVYQYSIATLDPRYSYIVSWKIVSAYGTEFWTELVNPINYTVTRGLVRATAARVMGLLVAEGTTTSASGGASIVDASTSNGGLVSDSDSDSRFDGCFLLFTSGPATGYWREISVDKYNPSTGTLTFATAFNPVPTPGGGDSYEIYAGLTPDQWSVRDNNTIVDFGLQRCRFMRRSPITLVTDGDMEANGVTAWTANNSVLAKSAIESVTNGAQSLLVVNTGSNGYAQSTAMPVIPGHGYSAWVSYRCLGTTQSTGTLQVWDNTNNVLIISGTDQDSGINFEGGQSTTGFTAPSNCFSVVFRLVGTESTAAIAWDDLIVITNGRRRYPTPSWILNRNQIMSYQVRDGSRPYEYTWTDVGWPKDIQEDPTAVNMFIVDIPLEASGRPLFVVGEGAYGPMSGTSDSLPSSIPLEWATFSCAREAWQRYSREIEGAAMQRAVMDRATVEVLAVQKDNMYMPIFQGGIGMPMGYSGMEIFRLP